MAVKCFDLPEVTLSRNIYMPTEKEEDTLTIPEARNLIKDRFAIYHKLFDKKESELLLAELELSTGLSFLVSLFN